MAKFYIAGTNGAYTEHEMDEGTTARQLLEAANQPTEGVIISRNESICANLDEPLDNEDIIILSMKTGGN